MSDWNGKGNVDPQAYHRAQKSFFYRSFTALPMAARIPMGVASVMAGSYVIYLLVMPNKTTRPIRTLNPEWEAANEAYDEAQNINPIDRYKKAGYY